MARSDDTFFSSLSWWSPCQIKHSQWHKFLQCLEWDSGDWQHYKYDPDQFSHEPAQVYMSVGGITTNNNHGYYSAACDLLRHKKEKEEKNIVKLFLGLVKGTVWSSVLQRELEVSKRVYTSKLEWISQTNDFIKPLFWGARQGSFIFIDHFLQFVSKGLTQDYDNILCP